MRLKLIAASVLVLLSIDNAWAKMDAAAFWVKKCGTCHGADGKGSAMMAKSLGVSMESLDLTKVTTREMSDGAIIKVIQKGRWKMPGFSNQIYEKRRIELLEHLRQLQTPSP